MKIIVSIFLLLINCNILAQSTDLQFVPITNDGTHYDVLIQIEANTAFNLGSSNLKFNFNGSDISNPSLLTAYNFSGGSYNTITVTEPVAGNIASINIELFTPGSGSQVNTGWTNVATVRFTIQNQAGSSQLSFRDMNPPETNNPTVIYKDDEATQVTEGSFGSLNTTPLPVELSSFSASVNTNNVSLNWKTATEVNNNGFEVERAVGGQKSDAGSWVKVGFVEGHGNSNSPKEYIYTDKNLTGGTKFVYRLKQVDNDGKYQYSKEVEVEVVPAAYELSQNYPNPFNPATEIKYNLPEASRVVLSVYNIIGQQVASLVNGTIEAGFHSVTFDGSSLPSGTYIYRLQTNNFVQTKKMVLLK